MKNSSQQFSTSDTELAAWLLYSGCEFVEVHTISQYEKLIVLNCPNSSLSQLLADFAASEGEAAIARGMYKKYRELIKLIRDTK